MMHMGKVVQRATLWCTPSAIGGNSVRSSSTSFSHSLVDDEKAALPIPI